MGYKNRDFIDSFRSAEGPQYSVHTRLYFFTDLDTDHIRDTYNKHLLPLGFELSEKRWTADGVDIVQLPLDQRGVPRCCSVNVTSRRANLYPLLHGRHPLGRIQR